VASPEPVDLSQYELQSWVREALTTALFLAHGSPVTAANALDAAVIVSRTKKSVAFSKWADLSPTHDIQVPSNPQAHGVNLADVPLNSFLVESFRIARPLFNKTDSVWGRDYITVALLAIGDPSLDELAAAAHRTLDSLREEWFGFLISTPASKSHREWANWWKDRGLTIPDPSKLQPVRRNVSDAASRQPTPETPLSEVSPQTAPSPSTPPQSPPTQAASPKAGTSEAAQPQPAPPSTPPADSSSPKEPELPKSPSDQPAQSRLPDVWMLSDRPIENRFAEQDRFQFQDYASALAAVLDHEKTETPFTMAINAPWGAGKTTLANMIAEQLRQRPTDRGHTPHIICWFNAWMHDDAPNLATAFISEVGRTANLSRRWSRRILNPLPSSLLEPSSRTWRQLSVASVVLVPTLLLSIWAGLHLQAIAEHSKVEPSKVETVQRITTTTKDPANKPISVTTAESHSTSTPIVPPIKDPSPLSPIDRFFDKFQSQLVALGAFFTALLGLLGILANAITSTPLGGFVKSPDRAAEVGAINAAEKQLRTLISQATWRGNRFVVFVDDIERCKPPRSVDVLDAVNQLMNHKNVIVVFLGDMSAVAASAQLKYKDIAEIFVPSAGIALTGPDRGKEAFGRLYLQKIIQFQFDLPIPPTDKIRDYMKRLAAVPQPSGDQDGAA
jgi:hypothetical protein